MSQCIGQIGRGRTTIFPNPFRLVRRGPREPLVQMTILKIRYRALSQLQRIISPQNLCQPHSCRRDSYRKRIETTTSYMGGCQRHICQTRLARSNSMFFLLFHNFPQTPQLQSHILATPSARPLRRSTLTIARSGLLPFHLLRAQGYLATMSAGTRSPGKRALRASMERRDCGLCLRWRLATASRRTNQNSRQHRAGE